MIMIIILPKTPCSPIGYSYNEKEFSFNHTLTNYWASLLIERSSFVMNQWITKSSSRINSFVKRGRKKIKIQYDKSFIQRHLVSIQEAIAVTGRKRAYLALELDDNIAENNTNHSVTVILSAIGIFGVWAAITPLSNVVRANGLVSPSENTILLSHQDGGMIKNILVKNGQEVLKGQTLMALDTSILETELLSMRQQLSNLNLQQAQLSGFINQEPRLDSSNSAVESSVGISQDKLLQSKILNFRSRIETLKGKIREKRVEVNSLAEQEKLYKERLAMWEGLTEQGAASRLKYLDVKSNYVLIQGKHREAKELLTQAIYDLNNLKTGELVKSRSLYASSKSEEAVLKENIKRLDLMIERSTVKSPINGTISDIQYTSKDTVVAPGAMLMKIVPQSDDMLGIVNIASDKIAFVKAGSNVKISILPYNSAIYGKLDGTIVSISGDSIYNKGKSAYFFEAEVRFNSQKFSGSNNILPIKAGMPIRAEIKTNDRTVLGYLFSPITKTLQNSFRD